MGNPIRPQDSGSGSPSLNEGDHLRGTRGSQWGEGLGRVRRALEEAIGGGGEPRGAAGGPAGRECGAGGRPVPPGTPGQQTPLGAPGARGSLTRPPARGGPAGRGGARATAASRARGRLVAGLSAPARWGGAAPPGAHHLGGRGGPAQQACPPSQRQPKLTSC